MGTCFLYGNGGGNSASNLDFYMKRYDTEEALLADSPKNHTIGVVTTLDISQWIMNASAGVWDTTDGAVTIVYKASSTYDDSTLHTKFFDGKISGFSGQAWMELFACYQTDGVCYIPVTAYVYKNDTWVKFSSSFSATISVTYPAGSTCTATCGSRTITAPDTTGTWNCVVPDAGSWVISCTNGTKTKSNTVSISTNGDSKSVTLTYELYLFNYGNEYSSTTGGWKATAKALNSDAASYVATPIITKNSNGSRRITAGGDGDGGIYYALNKIDVTEYTSLKFDGKIVDPSGYNRGFIAVWSSLASYSQSNRAVTATGNDGSSRTRTLDVSKLTGEYYIGFAVYGKATSILLSKLWLE